MTGDRASGRDHGPCLHCGRTVTKVGRRIGDRRVCRPCSYHYLEEQACPACGRAAKRLVRTKHHGQPVCDRCRTAIDHRTCSRCGRPRKVQAWDKDDKPLCKACAGPEPATHPCPDCGTVLPGSGRGRCKPCLAVDLFARRAALERGAFATDHGEAVFNAFCRWPGVDRSNPKTPGRLSGQAEALRSLEAAFDAGGRISQDAVLSTLGVEGARRVQAVIDFLVDDGRLEWDEERSAEWVELRRIDAVFTKAEETGHGDLLRSYFDHLTSRPERPLAARTIQTYLGTALRFLQDANVTEAAEVTEEAIRGYLRGQRGLLASLTPFRRYAELRTSAPLSLPAKRPTPVRRADRQLVARVRKLRRRLEHSRRPAERRALVAALISDVHGVPLEAILTLRREDVTEDRGRVSIAAPSGGVALRPWLGRALGDVMRAGEGFVFPGRGRGRSLTPSAVWHHMRAALNA